MKEQRDSVDLTDLLEEEAFMILHSGEIPEVAYYSAIHYLTRDTEGPGLSFEDIGKAGLMRLKVAVVGRYRLIILRDINPDNRDKRIYRGIQRAAVNWRRLKSFAAREGVEIGQIRLEVASALVSFLAQELTDVSSGRRESSINCTYDTLCSFIIEVGLSTSNLPPGIERLCRKESDL
ncbi:MAG: hypothetical protein ACUVQ6_06170 [Dissulfurimicrobium sp.]|uniref:hypothetical protein n=1 Tax=Dissulfurimicrobium sp. TaxID=2022436 RepID=UPI00404A5AD0